MKQHTLISCFLLALLLLQLSEQVLLKAWYALDTDSFSNTFCENVDAPQLECKASCFWEKESAEQLAQNETASATETQQPPSFIEAFVLPKLVAIYSNNNIELLNNNSVYQFVLKEWALHTHAPPPRS